MNRRELHCEIEDCKRLVNIRTTIKRGKHRGKKVCPSCKVKYSEVKYPTRNSIKKVTSKTKERRREERSGLPLFFKNAIEDVRHNPICVNCRCRIEVNHNLHWNVAHILPKSKYKSIMSHPDNYIILCSSKDSEGQDCHSKFDNSIENMPKMHCYQEAKTKFLKFKNKCLERGKIFTIFETND